MNSILVEKVGENRNMKKVIEIMNMPEFPRGLVYLVQKNLCILGAFVILAGGELFFGILQQLPATIFKTLNKCLLSLLQFVREFRNLSFDLHLATKRNKKNQTLN